MPANEVIERYEPLLEAIRCYGDAFPRWWPNFGPGIVAGFLGAEVEPKRETVWFSSPQPVPISELSFEFDGKNIWWKRVKELTETAVQRWGDQAVVAHTDLGGNLDILASFRTTEQLLLDLSDSPEEVERLLNDITRLWLRYYDDLHAVISESGRGTTPWAPILSARRCYMLQCDFSYMISPKMFERFVMPDLSACCNALDHGFYHLDGEGQIRHLDLLLSLERLRGIQWVPGDGAAPPEEWLPLLKRIRDAGKLCQLSVTAEGALTIARELGGCGFALQILDLMGEEDAKDFLKALAAADGLKNAHRLL